MPLALYVHFTRKVFMSNPLDHIARKLVCMYTHSEGLLWADTYYYAPNGMKLYQSINLLCFHSFYYLILSPKSKHDYG